VNVIRGRVALAAVLVALGAACTSSAPTRSEPPAQAATPAANAAYVWNAAEADKLRAMLASGDPARGEQAFMSCRGCHRAQALGRPDGSYPRLAGQHGTVLVKQLTDVQAGRRANEKMLPFADHGVLDTRDIGDVATYLTRLPVPPDNGKGPGTDLATGQAQYDKLCASCHGPRGEGDAAMFYPRVSGQHFKYLLRETVDIRDGKRKNADPRMVEVTRGLPDPMLTSIADYMSRLPVGPAR
jgi:cytochrome c553